MNSLERVKAALHFESPDRIPIVNLSSLRKILFGGDFVMAGALPPKSWQPGWRESEVGLFPYWIGEEQLSFKWDKPEWAKDPKYDNYQSMPHEEIDDWGCIWNRDPNVLTMGHPGRPSLPDWSKLDEYIDSYFLDPTDASRYKSTLLLYKVFGRKKYKMFMTPSLGPFSIASNMRGFTNFVIDHKKNPDKVKYLLEQITNNFLLQIKTIKKLGANINGVWMIEDLGSQFSPFFGPKLFKEFYEPVYKRLFDLANDYGCEFHQHCCGKIDKILPLLIDWGLDALQLDSPRMIGYSDFKPYRGKIMVWGCVNIQSVYPNGTPEDCKNEVWHMMRNLGTKDGGFGAYYYPTASKHIQVPVENVKAFGEGIKKFGNYSKIPPHWWDHPIVEDWDDNIVPPLPI